MICRRESSQVLLMSGMRDERVPIGIHRARRTLALAFFFFFFSLAEKFFSSHSYRVASYPENHFITCNFCLETVLIKKKILKYILAKVSFFFIPQTYVIKNCC